jgi:hypothetical protein
MSRGRLRSPFALLLVLIAITAVVFQWQSSSAATGVTVIIVPDGHAAVGEDVRIELDQTAALVIQDLGEVDDGETVALELPPSIPSFDPITIDQVSIDADPGDLFLAATGQFDQVFGAADVAVLIAFQWPTNVATIPSFSIGAAITDLDLSALNDEWASPLDTQPDLADSYVAFATADQDFPPGITGISDFYPDNFSFSDNTIDAGFTFNSGLFVRSVLGDKATLELFKDVDQVVSLRGHFNASLDLFNKETAAADDTKEAEIDLTLEASTVLSNPVGPSDWFAAMGTWTLTLTVDGAASTPQVEVSATGQIKMLGSLVNPPDGVVFDVAVTVTYNPPGDFEVTIEASTAEDIPNVFDTPLDINDVTLTLNYIKTGTETALESSFTGTFSIGATTISVTVALEAEGGALSHVAIEGTLATSVSISDIKDFVEDQLNLTSAPLAPELTALSLTGLSLRFEIDVSGTDKGRFEFAAVATSDYAGLDIAALFFARRIPGNADDTGFTVALRVGDGENPTLADLIPSLVGNPAGDIEVPNVIIGFTNIEHIWTDAPPLPIPDEIVEFFYPVLFPGETDPCDENPDCSGAQDFLDIHEGAFLASSFMLPSLIHPFLDELYIDHTEPVILTGSIGLFGDTANNVDLIATLPSMGLPPEVAGDWFESAQLSFGISFEPGPPPVISAFIFGTIDVKVPNTDNPSEDEDYDHLSFIINAELELSAGQVEITFTGAMVPPSGGTAAWEHPFGLEWLTINGLAIQLGVKADPTGIGFTFGFAGSIQVGSKDIAGSILLELAPLPAPPFVRLNPLGIRFASQAGIEFADMIAFANVIAVAAGDDPISLPPDLQSFNVGIKDIEVSWALEDTPELCLFEGIRLRGYLYIGAESIGYVPPSNAPCTPGDPSNTPGGHEGQLGCQLPANKDHGCFAGVDIEVSASTGLFAHVELGAFTLGPIETQASIFELVINTTEQSLTIEGGITIDNVLAGSISIGIRSDGWHIAGDLGLFPEPPPALYQSSIRAEAGLSITDPHFIIDGRIASNFGETLKPIVQPLAQAFATGVVVLNGLITTLLDPNVGFDALLPKILDIPNQLTQLGYGSDPIVVVLGHIASAFNTMRDGLAAIGIYPSIDGLINFALQGHSVSTPDILGIDTLIGCLPNVTSDPSDCVLIPGGVIFSIPGICPSLVNIPGCNAIGLKNLLISTLNGVLADLLGVSLDDLTTGLSQLAADFQANPIIFDVSCVAFTLALGVGDSVSRNAMSLRIKLIILGRAVYIGPLEWDFEDSVTNNLSGLLSALGDTLLGTTTPFSCDFGAESEPTGGFVPPSALTQTGATFVNEGSSVQLSGSFDAGTTQTGDTQTVTIHWPGGAETIDVPLGTTTFTSASRSFADDNPSSTAADTLSIPVSISNSRTGSDTASFSLQVRNVNPSVDMTAAPTSVFEGSAVTVNTTFSDVGTPDSFVVEIDWGDGITESFNLPAGSTSLPAKTHVYNTSGLNRTILVRVRDDDTGTGTDSQNIQVLNAPPVIDDASVMINTSSANDVDSIEENQTIHLVGSFSDAGPADTHTLTINWGDGGPNSVVPIPLPPPGPGGVRPTTRSFDILHVFLDDNPSGTAFDLKNITVTVSDGEDSDQVTLPTTVNNVSPHAATLAGAPTTLTLEGTPMPFSATDVMDVGSLDTFTYHWEVLREGLPYTTADTADWIFTPGDGGNYTMNLTVTDDDLGAIQRTVSFFIRYKPEWQLKPWIWGHVNLYTYGTWSTKWVELEIKCVDVNPVPYGIRIDRGDHQKVYYDGTFYYSTESPNECVDNTGVPADPIGPIGPIMVDTKAPTCYPDPATHRINRNSSAVVTFALNATDNLGPFTQAAPVYTATGGAVVNSVSGPGGTTWDVSMGSSTAGRVEIMYLLTDPAGNTTQCKVSIRAR